MFNRFIDWLIDNEKYFKWPILLFIFVIVMITLHHACEINHKIYMK